MAAMADKHLTDIFVTCLVGVITIAVVAINVMTRDNGTQKEKRKNLASKAQIEFDLERTQIEFDLERKRRDAYESEALEARQIIIQRIEAQKASLSALNISHSAQSNLHNPSLLLTDRPLVTSPMSFCANALKLPIITKENVESVIVSHCSEAVDRVTFKVVTTYVVTLKLRDSGHIYQLPKRYGEFKQLYDVITKPDSASMRNFGIFPSKSAVTKSRYVPRVRESRRDWFNRFIYGALCVDPWPEELIRFLQPTIVVESGHWNLAPVAISADVRLYQIHSANLSSNNSREMKEFGAACIHFCRLLNRLVSVVTRVDVIEYTATSEVMQKFNAKRETFAKKGIDSSEVWVFHGTSNDRVTGIIKHGFKVGGVDPGIHIIHGKQYGNGVYTATGPQTPLSYVSVCPRRDGHSPAQAQIILARALRGSSHCGANDDRADSWAPMQDWLVFKDGSQLLPAYVIHYTL